MRFKLLLGLSAAMVLLGCSGPQGSTSDRTTSADNGANSPQNNSEDTRFSDLLDAHWAWTLSTAPTFATSLGVRDYDDRLSDPSLAAYDAQVERQKEFLADFRAVNKDALSADNQLNLDLITRELESDIEASAYGGRYMIMTNRAGPHTTITGLPNRLPFFKAADYDSYLARLSAVPDYMSKATDRLRAGIEAGWVQPCAPMAGFEASIQTHLVDDVNDSVLMDAFDTRPTALSAQEFANYKANAATIVKGDVLPALKTFEQFYLDEYAPNCRDEVGTSSMPGGADYYAYRARMFTTTDMTPDDIHNIGLSEVARIRAEMAEVQKQAGFEGTFKEFQNYLRTNPDFYPKTAQERMDAAAVILKKMDGKLPELFTKFPRMPYGIKEIPLDVAEKTTTAYYMRPAGDGSRAGFYYINTTNLDKRPLYEMEALSLHEAVPGHHFQIALSQELMLPDFRKYGGFTAFIEGWGLYSERLGLDVGFYETPYTNFGRLSYEMWRACRLVVDTGMHDKGWTRQEAVDYMIENTGLSVKNINNEVDRYITWPGQALAYKIGELKIRELRALAESELGEDFDIRLFHDTVLENGAVPLSVLEIKVKDWIETQRG
ncbi:DUF885 family protein [Fretibacter rubidus]|uniref:DUF885 domain-containing protein n=1 Tax=Fretibacter rubidus TaxID=570162 RepID=UPI00352A950D